MEYHDKVLKCAECGAEFVFTGGEQMFFADKGFKNEPKRCKACKAKRAEGGGHAAPARTETKTNCSQCGKETTVPFRPSHGRGVGEKSKFQMRGQKRRARRGERFRWGGWVHPFRSLL